MATKTYMPIADDPDPLLDVILERTKPLPVFRGNEDEHLACPGCRGNIAHGISARAFEGRYATQRRLVFHCPCGTYSVLPSRHDPDMIAAPAPSGLERLG